MLSLLFILVIEKQVISGSKCNTPQSTSTASTGSVASATPANCWWKCPTASHFFDGKQINTSNSRSSDGANISNATKPSVNQNTTRNTTPNVVTNSKMLSGLQMRSIPVMSAKESITETPSQVQQRMKQSNAKSNVPTQRKLMSAQKIETSNSKSIIVRGTESQMMAGGSGQQNKTINPKITTSKSNIAGSFSGTIKPLAINSPKEGLSRAPVPVLQSSNKACIPRPSVASSGRPLPTFTQSPSSSKAFLSSSSKSVTGGLPLKPSDSINPVTSRISITPVTTRASMPSTADISRSSMLSTSKPLSTLVTFRPITSSANGNIVKIISSSTIKAGPSVGPYTVSTEESVKTRPSSSRQMVTKPSSRPVSSKQQAVTTVQFNQENRGPSNQQAVPRTNKSISEIPADFLIPPQMISR